MAKRHWKTKSGYSLQNRPNRGLALYCHRAAAEYFVNENHSVIIRGTNIQPISRSRPEPSSFVLKIAMLWWPFFSPLPVGRRATGGIVSKKKLEVLIRGQLSNCPLMLSIRLAVASGFHSVVCDGLCLLQRILDGLLSSVSGREFLAHFSCDACKFWDSGELNANIRRRIDGRVCWVGRQNASPTSF